MPASAMRRAASGSAATLLSMRKKVALAPWSARTCSSLSVNGVGPSSNVNATHLYFEQSTASAPQPPLAARRLDHERAHNHYHRDRYAQLPPQAATNTPQPHSDTPFRTACAGALTTGRDRRTLRSTQASQLSQPIHMALAPGPPKSLRQLDLGPWAPCASAQPAPAGSMWTRSRLVLQLRELVPWRKSSQSQETT